jgi:methylenetetrahydrofolate reductase (NADPH)
MALAESSTAHPRVADRAATIAQLASQALIELNVHDVVHLAEARRLLPPGTALYVSHVPKQQWLETESTCRAVRAAGFRPVPHVPVRLLPDAKMADRVLGSLVEGMVDRGTWVCRSVGCHART